MHRGFISHRICVDNPRDNYEISENLRNTKSLAPRLLCTLRAHVRFVTLSKTPDWMLSIPFLIVLYDQVNIIGHGISFPCTTCP